MCILSPSHSPPAQWRPDVLDSTGHYTHCPWYQSAHLRIGQQKKGALLLLPPDRQTTKALCPAIHLRDLNWQSNVDGHDRERGTSWWHNIDLCFNPHLKWQIWAKVTWDVRYVWYFGMFFYKGAPIMKFVRNATQKGYDLWDAFAFCPVILRASQLHVTSHFTCLNVSINDRRGVFHMHLHLHGPLLFIMKLYISTQ